MTPTMDLAAALDTAAGWLAGADRVLVTAGAGLSAAAGYDYADRQRFQELFPALHRLGLRARYELIGLNLPAELQWGFWAVHTTDIRFNPAPSPLYRQLRTLVGDRDHFVMTSNVDQLFARNGFDPDHLYTPQGDYGLYQCLTPCTRQVWPSEAIVRRALDAYDEETGATATDAVPVCPNCGGPVTLNVYAGAWYINDHFQPELHQLNHWLADTRDKHESLVVLEIGAGFNTPAVIRWPDERIVHGLPSSKLIRINLDHPDVPTEVGPRALALTADANAAITALAERHPRE